jgi:hypothetical protein
MVSKSKVMFKLRHASRTQIRLIKGSIVGGIYARISYIRVNPTPTAE